MVCKASGHQPIINTCTVVTWVLCKLLPQQKFCSTKHLKLETRACLTLHSDCVVTALLRNVWWRSCSSHHCRINKNTCWLSQPSAEGSRHKLHLHLYFTIIICPRYHFSCVIEFRLCPITMLTVSMDIFRSSCMVSFFTSFLTLWHLTTDAWRNIVTTWCHSKWNHSWVTRSPESSHYWKEQKWTFQCFSCTSKTVDKGRRSGCKWRNNPVYLYTFFFIMLWHYTNELPCQTSPRSLAQLTILRHPPSATPRQGPHYPCVVDWHRSSARRSSCLHQTRRRGIRRLSGKITQVTTNTTVEEKGSSSSN